jgi:hypothetical protein
MTLFNLTDRNIAWLVCAAELIAPPVLLLAWWLA